MFGAPSLPPTSNMILNMLLKLIFIPEDTETQDLDTLFTELLYTLYEKN